ncbi:MAG: GMC oxidoreductase, partial [Bacteriovoracaceae bacterium]
LAAGSIGNTRILKRSGLGTNNKNIGKDFFTHPQFMSLGIYDEAVNAHKGPFQAMKSNDKNFRKQGFKLENVFGPPVALSMLLPGFGKEHMDLMKDITRMACVEVAIRDKTPGEILVNSKGKTKIKKELGPQDLKTRSKGIKAIHNIFQSTGAKQIVDGGFNIGLHLMGGLGMGTDPSRSVVSPEFDLHFNRRIFCADSSVFPNAPGINPSLTVMAMSLMAAEKVLKRI